MLIKIISFSGEYSDDIFRQVLNNFTDWEEVDDDTYQILWKWVSKQNQKDGRQYAILHHENIPVQTCVAEYLKEIEAQKVRDERRKAAAQSRKEKRKLKQEALEKQSALVNEAAELELLNQLLAKHKHKISTSEKMVDSK